MAKAKKRKAAPGDVASNRQASYRFELLDKLECGVVLEGTEVKSLRGGAVQIKDGYAAIHEGELWLHNVHIPPYGPAAGDNHEPERVRKLLAHRREIERLIGRVQERGLTLVPTRIYFKDGRAKVELGLAKGKKFYDKRQAIATRTAKREAEVALGRKFKGMG
jgi:SsrA-binding protein